MATPSHYRHADPTCLAAPVPTTVAADAFLAASSSFPEQLGRPLPHIQQQQQQQEPQQRHCHRRQQSCYATAHRALGGDVLASAKSDTEEDEVGEDDDEIRDCVIVGAGIAGLAAAADLEGSGLDFVLLEAGLDIVLGMSHDVKTAVVQ